MEEKIENKVGDIDLDFPDRNKILQIIKYIPASIIDHEHVKKHNTGVYCQSIPVNPLTNTASIDYKSAEDRGYFKIDFLNVGIYKDIKDEQHLIRLLNVEPTWELLEQKEFTDMLFHINGHHQICQRMKPRSIPQLAAVLAMIRPAKRHLIGLSWDDVMKDIWTITDQTGYAFKKSHAHGYALAVVVQMNLICEQLTSNTLGGSN